MPPRGVWRSYTIGFILWFTQFPFFFIERQCTMANLPYPACCVPSDSAEDVFKLLDDGDCKLTLAELQAHDLIADADDTYWKPFAAGAAAAHDAADHDGTGDITPAEFAGWWAMNGCTVCGADLGAAAAETSILIMAVGVGNFLTIILVGQISDCFGRKKAL